VSLEQGGGDLPDVAPGALGFTAPPVAPPATSSGRKVMKVLLIGLLAIIGLVVAIPGMMFFPLLFPLLICIVIAAVILIGKSRVLLTLAFIPVLLVLAVIVGIFLVIKAFYVG
jgi:hypothetical protein